MEAVLSHMDCKEETPFLLASETPFFALVLQYDMQYCNTTMPPHCMDSSSSDTTSSSSGNTEMEALYGQ